ncbi:MAG: cbb3-type cytochrome c oxidase subunit II [Deltaproteobacteria bacterium]|nr:cbb3-type cytochrome c oxidase subunit II [Deltaproteobacteria bacterium]
MKMSPSVLLLGALIVFSGSLAVGVILPAYTMNITSSKEWRNRTEIEEIGRTIYIANGCTGCHSQYVRTLDWGIGAQRIARIGDYVGEAPHLLGSERTGPDLSQQGGEHSDDWHVAHFINPRFTSPESIMPPFAFLKKAGRMKPLIAYVQSLGGKDADFRIERQQRWKKEAVAAYEAGPDANIKWLHSHVPGPWMELPNPYAATPASLARGHKIYQSFCIGCHGPIGDGQGPAAPSIYPPPLNFTTLRRTGVSGGALYYQIMNGITGTAMPYFKKHLESEKIWDVGNYVAQYFIGVVDSNKEPRGIDASYEGPLHKE